MDKLVTLPGVGRKTANVILGNAFGIPGITVDTHFGRLVRRWRWTTAEDPVKVEQAVGELIERKEWTLLSHRVIFHGRRVCHARRPACGVCVLAKDCPSFGLGPTEPLLAAPWSGPRDRSPAGPGWTVMPSLPTTPAETAMTTLTGKTRWTIAILAVVAALMAALVAQLHDYSASSTISQRPAPREHRDGDTPEALAWSRQRANLPPCPAAGNGPARRHYAVLWWCVRATVRPSTSPARWPDVGWSSICGRIGARRA